MKKREGKKGQVTIFIIVAIIVVAMVALIYLFWPEIQGFVGIEAQPPSSFMSQCLGNSLNEEIGILATQGGSFNPELYMLYKGDKVEYLCYSEQYYRNCVMQQPLLKKHIESELATKMESQINSCIKNMKNTYERMGYKVNMRGRNISIELLPKRAVVRMGSALSLSRGGETKTYNSVNVAFNNNLYELISIADSILSWETIYGDSETTAYMNFYHDLKVEKIKQTDGSTIYILTDRNTGDKFQFASRSVALPPSYGTGELTYD